MVPAAWQGQCLANEFELIASAIMDEMFELEGDDFSPRQVRQEDESRDTEPSVASQWTPTPEGVIRHPFASA